MYTTRRILLPELRRLHMAHPDFADSGWAVCHVGNEEKVIDWFADRQAAVEEAERLNQEEEES